MGVFVFLSNDVTTPDRWLGSVGNLLFLSNGVTTPERWLGSVGGLCVSVK